MTIGQLLFYGGIAGVFIFGILTVVMWTIFEKKKKKLICNIEQEYK